ncbi:conserved hypothetical protein [Histoplasma capsulatum G186AR]|uniref:Uncharacterized protein n=1 Tax=Ajellomyces capsulatus (strain G186AR / H82 / ATCC MYA-2454 / RMSCC 2432) TaxID=447093 RepID=C0NZI5_AJECG|nr:uncharacterized protein HCBG_08565 [Histoplasma capsulatum G186AR]EEH03233.1 conserved hypothetical protein [Histoplasma capsulatum G186AR]
MASHFSRPRTCAIPIIDPSGQLVSVDSVNGVSRTSPPSHSHPRTQTNGVPSTASSNSPRQDVPVQTYSAGYTAPALSSRVQNTPAGFQGQQLNYLERRREAFSVDESHHFSLNSQLPAWPSQRSIYNGTNQPAGRSTTWKPDVYARSYVPAYLIAINRSPAVDRYSTQLKSIDFASYVARFSGTSFLEPLPVENLPTLKSVPVSISRHTRNLSPSSYLYYFDECLLLEGMNYSQELSGRSLYNVILTLTDARQNLYSLHVPGLKDGAPKVGLGDTVLVRQIVPFPQLAQQGAEWLSHNKTNLTGSIAPGFSGHQLHAVVWGISMAKETIIIRIDHLLPTSRLCNIQFTVQPDLFVPLWRAVVDVTDGRLWEHEDVKAEVAGSIENKRNWLRHMLFPEPSDGVLQTMLPKGAFEHNWADKDLNYQQMKAVDSIITRNYGTIPFLISGVPGSGKTKTVVECTLQLLHQNDKIKPHILLCAPSNPAADTLAMRLAKHLQPHEMFRLNGWSRTFAEVPDQLLPYTHSENDLFSMPEFKTMMSYKVVVTTCMDAHILVRARLSNQDLMKLGFEMFSSISPGIKPNPRDMLHWTALIVDEAAQATEPMVCIPLSVVATPLCVKENVDSSNTKSSLPLFIMAGDEHQLGPRVSNTNTAFSVSLFERLFSLPIYADHPLSRRNAGPYKKLTQEMLPIPRPAFTNLTRNYRSHTSILAMPSVLFYSDTLIPSATPAHPDGPVPSWPVWKAPHRWPILFTCNTSPDDVEEILHSPAGSGLFNQGEALKALHFVQSLLDHSNSLSYPSNAATLTLTTTPMRPITQQEIAVITPFLTQVTHLRRLFRDHNLHSVNIGPVEAFQGLESRFLIICTTRTRAEMRFIQQDQSFGLGLVGERRRFNMAMTRAKEGLIVIGNPDVLVGVSKDESWRAFLSFCARNGCWDVDESSEDAGMKMWAWADRLAGHRRPGRGNVNGYGNRGGSGSGSGNENGNGNGSGNGNGNGNGVAAHAENYEEEDDIRLQGYVSRLERGLLYAQSAKEGYDGVSGPVDGENSGDATGRHYLKGGRCGQEKGKGYLGKEWNTVDDYDAAMWTAGIAAEEVLRGSLDD